MEARGVPGEEEIIFNRIFSCKGIFLKRIFYRFRDSLNQYDEKRSIAETFSSAHPLSDRPDTRICRIRHQLFFFTDRDFFIGYCRDSFHHRDVSIRHEEERGKRLGRPAPGLCPAPS